MAQWPRICVRCGKNSPDKIHERKFVWKNRTWAGEVRTGNMVQQEWAHLNVHAYICKDCERIGKIRWFVTLFISAALLLVTFPLVFGAFGDMELWGLFILCPAIFFFIWTILMRRPYLRYYAHFTISPNYWVTGRFKSKKYQEAWDTANPGGIGVKR